MKYDLIDIGKRLRELRVEHGYQQKYVAKKIGVSPSNICNWEQGRYGLTLEHLIMIAKFYNTDPGYILVGEKKKPKRVPFGALIDGDELVHISFGPDYYICSVCGGDEMSELRPMFAEALTSESAIQSTIYMWTDMQRDLGENPDTRERCIYKWHWLIDHGYSTVGPFRMPENECFLCERARLVWMDLIGVTSKCSCCPIDWPEKEVTDIFEPKCVGHNVDYLKAPLSDILNYLKDEKNHAQWRITT